MMENTQKLAQFSIPGGSSGPQELQAASGIPQAFRGGLDSSGTAFFQTVVNNLIIIGSFLALLMVIVSGIQWMMSRGNPDGIAAARKRFLFAIIGLLVMLAAFFIVRVIVFFTGGNINDFLNPSKIISPAGS